MNKKTMEDTRITFETAKLAKEKGFNEILSYHYDKTGFIQNVTTNNEKLDYGYSAPTQSLIAKWLREEHNLHINICSLSVNCFSFMLEKLEDTGTTLHGGHLGKINYNTYEEAYEIGLQEALKLI